MKFFIDLFSGLGGASSAFIEDDAWHVLRLDNNRDLLEHTKGTTILDVLDAAATVQLITRWLREKGAVFRGGQWVGLYSGQPVMVVLWASPPCYEFSEAHSAPASIAKREGRSFVPSLEAVEASDAIREAIQPTYWFIENVRGAIPWFRPLLGEWTQHHGAFYLWGVHPRLHLDHLPKHNKREAGDKYRHAPRWLRSNQRAKVPLAVSQAVKDALNNQKPLTYWLD